MLALPSYTSFPADIVHCTFACHYYICTLHNHLVPTLHLQPVKIEST